MKALKVLALLLILGGVVANASAHTGFLSTGILCGSSTDPTLCDQTTGEDLACTEFCGATCSGFINVTANCQSRIGGGYKCVCHGTPVP